MTGQRHLLKRNGRFHFRRRIAGLYTGNRWAQIPLGTTDTESATILSRRLAVEMDTIMEGFLLLTQPLPDDLVAQYYDAVLRQTVREMTRQNRLARMSGRISPDASRHHEIRRLVLTFLLEDGLLRQMAPSRVATFTDKNDLSLAITIYAREYEAIRSSDAGTRMERLLAEIADTRITSLEHRAQLREAYLQAQIDSAPQVGISPAPAPDALPLPPSSIPVTGSAVPPGPQTSRLTTGVSLLETPLTLGALKQQMAKALEANEELNRDHRTDPFGTDLAGTCERSIKADLLAGKIDATTADARRSTVQLFAFLTGLQLATEVAQYHLKIFRDNLGKLPVSFGKSERDMHKTLEEVLDEASSMPANQLGRAPSTINRHLTTLGGVLHHGRVEDRLEIERDLDWAHLKVPETKRARQKRNGFVLDEVKQVFQNPVWQGCKSAGRRRLPGDLIIKDGLFWVPLLTGYTGARRAEISGLMVEDIVEHDGHPGLFIQPNAVRGLKNLQSERSLPVHPHLLDLGFMEHVQQRHAERQPLLFPELRPSNPKQKAGDQIDHLRRMIFEQQLDGNPRGLDLHSLRHFFNTTLKRDRSVPKSVRLDILGHAGADLNEEVYSDTTPFADKLEAIRTIPSFF